MAVASLMVCTKRANHSRKQTRSCHTLPLPSVRRRRRGRCVHISITCVVALLDSQNFHEMTLLVSTSSMFRFFGECSTMKTCKYEPKFARISTLKVLLRARKRVFLSTWKYARYLICYMLCAVGKYRAHCPFSSC